MLKSYLLWSVAAVAAVAVSTLGMFGSGGASAAPEGSPLGATFFPNVPLVTQNGETVRFYDDLIKGKKVLINFIYADCVKACPLSTAKMVQIQKRLGSRVGRDIFIYSITLDPEHDTPEVLKDYAGKYGVGPGWLLLTGKRKDIDAVRFKLGERAENLDEHNNLVRVGDGATGHWMKLSLFEDLNVLAGEIGQMLDPAWYARQAVQSFEDAPRQEISEEARMLLKGQSLFQNRCAACHSFGNGDHLGPDLQGVATRRDRAWLARFISAPDQMRARKDPIAVELAAKYAGVPMPNVVLTREQVLDLVDYLEAQTSAFEQRERN